MAIIGPGQIVNCNQIGHNYGPHVVTDHCTATSLAHRYALAREASHDGWFRQYLTTNGVNVDALTDQFPQCLVCGARNVEDAGDHADSTGHWPLAPCAW